MGLQMGAGLVKCYAFGSTMYNSIKSLIALDKRFTGVCSGDEVLVSSGPLEAGMLHLASIS